ncbi:MAG: hypothetical protein Kow00124_01670 [Anaerolineae bacterium]
MSLKPAELMRHVSWRKVLILAASVLLFIVALRLMQAGARGLEPLVRDVLKVSGPVSGMGFGWLLAYVVLSGSPAAAAALTLFDVGVVDHYSAFAMITGSRMGASLIVLFIGLLYVLRGHERLASLATGLLSLLVTATVYLPALPLGLWLLSIDRFGLMEMNMSMSGDSLLDRLVNPAIDFAARLLPDWAIFLIGVGIIISSFNLFDKVLPDRMLKDSAFDQLSRLLYRPIVTFMLGLVVTLVTMSVSVSLGLLVPLSVRGYVRHENVVPYIMGCNISTFVDTLLAGLLLGNPGAAAIVLAQMSSVFVISLLIILFAFVPYERYVLRMVLWLSGSTARLVVFFAVIFLLPVALLIFG